MSYECRVDGCTREFDSKGGRRNHEADELRYEGDPKGDGRIFRCVEGDCGAEFLDRVARDGHLQTHGGPDPESFVPKGGS